MKSPIALLSSLLADFGRLEPGVKGLERDLVTLERRYEDEGYGFLTKALPALCDSFVEGISTGRFTCPPGFKVTRGGTIPRLFSGMFCEVFEPETGLLRESPNLGVLKNLYQILKLFKKTQLSPKDEASLHAKAVEEFYQCDETASRVVIPDRQDHLIGLVCKLLLPTLKEKDVNDAEYKHGPGAVEEGCSSNQKWKLLHEAILRGEDSDVPEWSSLLEFQTLAELDQSDGGHQRLHNRMARILGKTESSDHANGVEVRSSRSGRPSTSAHLPAVCARLVTVPKNSTSRRTITVEPLLKQFHQQGLNIMLRDSIKECRVLRRCLALTRQEHNQRLALKGSKYGNWATIDLKSASDLLSVKLVESVFRHHTEFLSYAMDCRSPMVKSDLKSPITLGKFAGMGNALTFPVQSVCFATICIAAILDSRGLRPTWRNVRHAAGCLRVYGDDIIVRTEFSHQCVSWLQSVGLRVNEKKSFLKGNFRESCGVDAYAGVDVTPLYLRYRPEDIADSPNVCASLVALSNHLWMQGLYKASDCVRDHVESHLGVRLPLVGRESGSLGWHSRLDASAAHKWCRRTQQLLTRVVALVPLKRKDRLDGYPALLKSLLTPLLGRDIGHLEKTAIRYKMRMGLRWVATRVA